MALVSYLEKNKTNARHCSEHRIAEPALVKYEKQLNSTVPSSGKKLHNQNYFSKHIYL